MRLFLLYVVVELAVIVALASTIGFGWTVLLLLGTFVVGLALAGSQVKRHIRRLRSGLNAPTRAGRAVTDSVLVALGTVARRHSRAGQLRRRCASAAAAHPRGRPPAGDRDRRAPARCTLITVGGYRGLHRGRGRGDYIDGEVIDVADVEPRRPAVERKPD